MLADMREVIRCVDCLLVQYRTQSGFCRRCGVILPNAKVKTIPTPPKVEYIAPATLISKKVESELKAFPLRVRKEREAKSWTQYDMARLTGVPRTYISRIENHRLLPGLSMCLLIRSSLEVSLDWLVSGLLPRKINSLTPVTLTHIGSRLRQARLCRGLSQGDVEIKTGMLRTYLSRIETNYSAPYPTLKSLLRLQKAFPFTFEELIRAEEEEHVEAEKETEISANELTPFI
jgi:transcriptional regulator with XRE-family HTH domain